MPQRDISLEYRFYGKPLLIADYNHHRNKICATLQDEGWAPPAGSMIAVTTFSNDSIQILDIKSGGVLGSLPTHKSGLRPMAFSKDESQIAIVGGDNSLTLWGLEPMKPLKDYNTLKVSEISVVSFIPNNDLMVTGHNDGSINIWDIGTGDILEQFDAHDGWIETLAVSPNGRFLVSGSPDGKVILTELEIEESTQE